MDHSTVRVRAELGSAIPEGMKGTLHLDWYDPNNVLANISTATNNGHGTRDNDEDVVLNAAGNGLPGWTLTFTATDSGNENDSVQKSYLSIADARYADNFIVAAHPNADTVELYEFQSNILKYQDTTGLWSALPNSTSCDLITSTLTIMPSVDIDTDSDDSGTIERSDWEESIENEADYTGKYVRFNNNDDNENDIADYQEYPGSQGWTAFSDPDLVQVILDRGFADLSGMAGWIFELKVTTGSDFGLKYWLDDEKSPIINGTNNGLPVQITENGKSKHVYQWTVSSDGTVDYPSSIYVEGVNAHGKTDTLMWRLLKPVTPVQPGDPTLVEKAVDTVKMTDPPFIDLAIDSDNDNGDCGGPGGPAPALPLALHGKCEEPQWEDIIEDSPYGVGKVLVPEAVVPIVVKMTRDRLEPYDYQIVFSDYIVLGPGAIEIYMENGSGSYTLISRDQYYTVAMEDSFTPQTITFYVVGVTQNLNVTTYEEIRDNPKQETRITVKFFRVDRNGSNQITPLGSDTVRYVVANKNTFYYQMATDQAIRAAIASNAIYPSETPIDVSKFGLRPSYGNRYDGIDFDTRLMQTVRGYVKGKGFNADIYLDYSSGKQIITFQGTKEVVDWADDLWQPLIKLSSQYTAAMNVGNYVRINNLTDNILFTGHSLGGGLASAATFLAIPEEYDFTKPPVTYTFNAAHFFQGTLVNYVVPRYWPKEARHYIDLFKNRAANLIHAYIVEGEIVDTLANPPWGKANGRRILLPPSRADAEALHPQNQAEQEIPVLDSWDEPSRSSWDDVVNSWKSRAEALGNLFKKFFGNMAIKFQNRIKTIKVNATSLPIRTRLHSMEEVIDAFERSRRIRND